MPTGGGAHGLAWTRSAKRARGTTAGKAHASPVVDSMIPDPLHHAFVHPPIALAILIPILAILGILLIQKGIFPLQT